MNGWPGKQLELLHSASFYSCSDVESKNNAEKNWRAGVLGVFSGEQWKVRIAY